jgi:murein DD-endopeptidase MepM/ murein hydrolase activator NlpD
MANPPQPLRPDFASLEVESFQHVPGGRELALLRLEGRYRSRLARPLFEAALLVDDGLAIHRHEALPDSTAFDPSAADDEWLWRAAFAVSLAALEDPETAFVLEAGAGISIELDEPTAWQAPPSQRTRAKGPVAVGRRAAAAAMLLALAVTPSTGLAEAAVALKLHGSAADSRVARAARSNLVAVTQLCRPGVAVSRIACAPSKAPGRPTASTSAPHGTAASHSGGKGGSKGDGKGPSSSGTKDQHQLHGPRHVHHSPRPHTPRPAPHHTVPRAPLRHSDGSPSRSNPSYFDALPGPATKGVPNFVIQKFRVPIFLLPIFQAAGTQYGIRWEVLAAINEIETDYGRNLNVSSAGALGWMQFMPATWRQYGVDANRDGKRDPYNPVDAIFAAAKYLKAAGGDTDIKKAIFAYNHAGWYVDSVMLRAKLLAGVPIDVVGSLTGLTEGRFPVAAHARYADDINEKHATRKVKRGQNAAHVVNDVASRHQISIYSTSGAPVVAVSDGVVKRVGHDKRLGRYIVLQDAYGNQYTYSDLGSVEHFYPVPKKNPGESGNEARAVSANGAHSPQVVTKKRVFAHPARVHARTEGGMEQIFDEQAASGDVSTYSNLFTPDLGLNARNSTLRRLSKGAHVIAGTRLGRVGTPDPKQAAHVNFGIRPAGKDAPQIDPKPILDGWKLLESTAIYRAKGKNVLNDSRVTIGQILMMPKALLEKRVLNDSRIRIYPGGRIDIKTGQIDRRVLAVLAFLAESGLNPTVSSLKGNHGYHTTSGNVSEHSSGNAVDIAAVNGIPIVGHQDRGGITEQTVRRLMTLQGTMRPHQIISLLSLGQNTLAMSDHNDHIHVGFHPMYGNSKKVGTQAQSVLQPGQWSDLIGRLKQIQNPVVPTSPSRYALPARHHGD